MKFFIAICLTASLSAPAIAADCPVKSGDEKFKIIAAAPDCKEAVDLFKLCAIGASLDARLAVPVIDTCKKRFYSKLTPDRRKAYETAIDKCNAQFAKKQGTMYRSMAASCRVNVSYKYSMVQAKEKRK